MSKPIGNRSALEHFLATIPSPSREPDEFTASEIHASLKAKGDTRTHAAISNWMNRSVKSGLYTKRKVPMNGRSETVYRLGTQPLVNASRPTSVSRPATGKYPATGRHPAKV